MALLDGDLRKWMLQRPAIGDVVGDRIHALRFPQNGALPALVLTLVSSNPVRSNDGYSLLRFRRIQVDIYSEDFDVLESLGQAVFEELEGFEGFMGITPVRHVFLKSERDLDEAGLEVDTPLFRRSQDYEFAEGAEGES